MMGMIPSSVTLRLSLDPTTISSFRVTCVDKWKRTKTEKVPIIFIDVENIQNFDKI